MQKEILILMLVLVLPGVAAFTIQTNTTFTLDWVGGNLAYLRTEGGDFLINANESTQVDATYRINLTRETGTNLTEFDVVMGEISNLTKSCDNITEIFRLSRGYYSELEANWTRCNLDKNALMIERDLWDDSYKNLSENTSQVINTCISQKDTLTSQVNSCTYILNNTSALLVKEKNANSQKTMLVVICIVIAGIFIIQEIQRKQKAHPDEMQMLSQQ